MTRVSRRGVFSYELNILVRPEACSSRRTRGDELAAISLAEYGPTSITGFARICGHPAAIIASNGVLSSEATRKDAHFGQPCD